MLHHKNAFFHIAIAGFMGAGKSTVAQIVSQKTGMKIIDADAEAKLLMQENTAIRSRLAHTFGAAVVQNGVVDFKELGRRAFGSVETIEQLNTIVHGLLIKRLEQLLIKTKEPRILDAALMPLWHIESWFGACLWVDAHHDLRRNRVAQRTGLPMDIIERRMAIQYTLLKQPATILWCLLTNNETEKELSANIENILIHITKDKL